MPAKSLKPGPDPHVPTDSEREANCVFIFSSLMRVHDAFMSIGEETAVSFGLHIAEMNVIDTLGKLGPVTMGALSRATFISPANTTHTVKKLESRGLVVRQRSPESDRVVIARLSTKGAELYKDCYPKIQDRISALLDERIGNKGRRELAVLLDQLQG